MTDSKTVGDRLKEERLRLRLTIDALAQHGGVGKNAQIKYEKNERKPDTEYLQGIDTAKVDVLYVITGVRRLDWINTEAQRQLLQTILASGNAATGHGVAEAFTDHYSRAVQAGRDPGITLTDRHTKLLTAFDKAPEGGKKMIERIAGLEAARAKPKEASQKVSAHAVEISGDGNVIGNNNKTKTKSKS